MVRKKTLIFTDIVASQKRVGSVDGIRCNTKFGGERIASISGFGVIGA